MCATSEMPQATNRPSDCAAPATWLRACSLRTPQTWLTFTPTFSKTAPRIRRDSPPPCSRWPSGLLPAAGFEAALGLEGLEGGADARLQIAETGRRGLLEPPLSTAPRSCAAGSRSRRGGALVHVVDEPRHRVRIGFRPDAVSQIEDMSRERRRPHRARGRCGARRSSGEAKSAAGSRLPCTAFPGPSLRRTAPSGERQSTPMTSTSRSATHSISAEPWLT